MNTLSRRLLLAAAAVLLLPVATAAQQALRSQLQTIPDSLLTYLTRNDMLDLIDYRDSGINAEVSNRLGGRSRLTTLTDSVAVFELNEACRMSVVMLATDGGNDTPGDAVFCVVRTFGTVCRASEISFFDADWRLLPPERFIALPSCPVEIAVSPSNVGQLTVTVTHVSDERADNEQENHADVLTTFKWDEKIFKKI